MSRRSVAALLLLQGTVLVGAKALVLPTSRDEAQRIHGWGPALLRRHFPNDEELLEKDDEDVFPSVGGLLKFCPNATAVEPCVCDNGAVHFNMDCSAVQTQERLKEIFSEAHFPSIHFDFLIFNSNKYIKVLEKGLLKPQNLTFKEIHIRNSALQNVQLGAFEGQEDTLVELDLFNNQISTFQDDLSNLTALKRLQLDFNTLDVLPTFQCENLTHLSLGGNNFFEIPPGSFDHMPELTKLSLENMNIETLSPGLFDNLAELTELRLDGNKLTTLTENSINLNSSAVRFIDLYGNQISLVEPGAINVGGGSPNLYLGGIQLTTLEEVLWKPLLENHVQIFLSGAELGCGCELAWLVEEPALVSRLPMATCSDGRLVADLNPDDYVECY